MRKPRKRTMDELRKLAAESPQAKERQEALQEIVRQFMESRRRVSIHLPTKRRLRFGLIGDTHIGSIEERIDALDDYYANAKERGITDILHAGDILAGDKVYRGQEYELHKRGWAEQRDHAVASLPDVGGITTHFIIGNHDTSFKRQIGIDVGAELAERRPDWHFVGEDTGEVILETADGRSFRVLLIHPGGGTAYALSYRCQKIVESLTGGTKPDMVAIGHYHKMEYIPSYRNVAIVQVGCFENQTPFMRRQGLQAHVGGWFIEVDFLGHDAGQMQVKAEALTYY